MDRRSGSKNKTPFKKQSRFDVPEVCKGKKVVHGVSFHWWSGWRTLFGLTTLLSIKSAFDIARAFWLCLAPMKSMTGHGRADCSQDGFDSCQIDGESALSMTISASVAGNSATVSAVVNAAARILQALRGLLLMTDIGLSSFA